MGPTRETGETAGTDLTRRLDGELRLVHEAILLVASGGASAVLVAGLRLGPVVIEPAQRLAQAAGVRVIPVWTADETMLDIRVEALAHD